MANRRPLCYYKIYDDKEQFSYIKSALPEKKIRGMLRRYERIHEDYYNAEFVKFLRKYDRRAEIIEVNSISY
jgi:hypothetical protein